jgi:polyferredoxin
MLRDPRASPGGFDLLTALGLRRLLRHRYARLALQIPILLLALFVVVDGLTGRQLAPRNVATTAVWLHYRGLIVIAAFVIGNLFCAACPLMLTRGAARFTKRILGREWRWPRRLQHKGIAIALLALFFYAYEAFHLWQSPWLTAWLAIGYFLAAYLVDTLFPAGTFCRYLCPLGQFNFTLAAASPTQIATIDERVCDDCLHKPCLHGRISDVAEREGRHTVGGALRDAVDGPRRAAFIPLHEVVNPNGAGRFPGCETGLFVPTITSNMDCTLCFNCLRACPYDNVTLRVRTPWRELATRAFGRGARRSALLMANLLAWWGALNAFAMVPPYFALAEAIATALGTRAEWVVLAVAFTAVGVIGTATTIGVAALADRAAGWRGPALASFDRWGGVMVALAFGFWSAHYLYHFLTGAFAIVPVMQHFFALRGAAIDPDWALARLIPQGWLFPVGAAAVAWGAAIALVVTVRIALAEHGVRGLAAMWIVGAFVLLAAAGQILILGLPMEMRGTLLGPP